VTLIPSDIRKKKNETKQVRKENVREQAKKRKTHKKNNNEEKHLLTWPTPGSASTRQVRVASESDPRAPRL
jgi:hypothetical protein